MTTTTNLEAEHWTAQQNQPEVTVNESLDVFDAAVTGTLTHNMTSDANYTLVATGGKPQEWMYNRIIITDTGVLLTTNRNIIVPTNAKDYVFNNQTLQNLLIKTSGGTGQLVGTGVTVRVRCDGTNVVNDDAVLFSGSRFQGYSETFVVASATGSVNFSCASANVFDVILVGNASVVFTDVPSVGNQMFTSTLFVTQDAGGTNALVVKNATYASSEASTVSQGASEKDIWIFSTKDGGASWYGMAAGLTFA